MREITFGMLVGIKIDGNKNPLPPLSGPFISWAKTKGGCWWWIRNGARECLGAGMIVLNTFMQNKAFSSKNSEKDPQN